MIIKLNPVESKDKITARIAEKTVKMQSSNYNKMASGDYGQNRVHEGELMLMRYQNEIKQLEDIRNNAPAEPTVTILAYQSYNEREILKANGFRWDGNNKCWYLNIAVANLNDVLSSINTIATAEEKNLAGISYISGTGQIA